MAAHHDLPPAAPATHVVRLADVPADKNLNTIVKEYSDFKEQRRLSSEDGPFLCDFAYGNPHDHPSANFVETLGHSLMPKSNDHYRYRTNEQAFCKIVADACRRRYPFSDLSDDDVFLTTGNFSGLLIATQLLVEPHSNVIYMNPGWFFYHRLILHARAVPKSVHMSFSPDTHLQDDMDSFLNAIDENTKLIIFNSPHNPSGKVYPRHWLEQFSARLMQMSKQRSSPIYVLCDEAYSDYVYGQVRHVSLATIYPYCILAYTYNKMTLAPSQRIGYLLLSPLMPQREQLRQYVFLLQMTNSWSFPNADMMESLGSLEKMRDNFQYKSVIERRRDRMSEILQKIGYELLVPVQGAFYMLVKSPVEDDKLFCRKLQDANILVLPGFVFNTPGCFRISLTCSDDMVEGCVHGFGTVFSQTAGSASVA